jgi:NADP-dependent 3-hydroxy acid dehydrogenase YdfG
MNIAIVTGASSGMGRQFVLQLSQYVQVDEIWAIARRQTALESLQAETPVPVRPISLDLLDSGSFTAFAKLLEQESPMSSCWSMPSASANSAILTIFPWKKSCA